MIATHAYTASTYRAMPHRMAVSADEMVEKLRQGEELESGRRDTRKYRRVLEEMAQLTGSTRTATSELKVLLKELDSDQDADSLRNYLKLLRASEGTHPSSVRSVFLELEQNNRQADFKPLNQLVPLIGEPWAALDYLQFLNTNYQEPKQRELALELTEDLQSWELRPEQLQTTVQSLMSQSKPLKSLKGLQELVELTGDLSSSIRDIEAAQNSKELAWIKRMRRQVNGQNETIKEAKELIFADEEQRKKRDKCFSRLLNAGVSLPDAVSDLKLLLEGGDQDLLSAATEFITLVSDVGVHRRSEIRETFAQVRALKSQGDTGWLARLGFGVTPEKAFRRLSNLHESPREALADLSYLDSLSNDESLGERLERLEALYFLDQGPSQTEAHASLSFLYEEDQVFSSPSRKMKTLRLMSQDTGSLSQARIALQGMLAEATPEQFDVRMGSFYNLLDRGHSATAATNYLNALGTAGESGAAEFFEQLMEPKKDDNLALAPAMAQLAVELKDFEERDQVAELVNTIRRTRSLEQLNQFLAPDPTHRLIPVKRLSARFGGVEEGISEAFNLEERSQAEEFAANLESYSQLAASFPKPDNRVIREHLDWAFDFSEKKEYQSHRPARLLEELAKQVLVAPDMDPKLLRRAVIEELAAEASISLDEEYLIVGDFMVELNED